MDITKQEGTGYWPHGVRAITLFVEDLETTKAFYQKVFGLPMAFDDETPHFQLITLFEGGDSHVRRESIC